ncbi:hypothetical protein C0992_007560, partial [Termitomyces sp. T32_za158]
TEYISFTYCEYITMLRQVMGPEAANENTSETLQFPKFNGTNYHVWSDNMKAALQSKALWGVVSGREPRPPKPPAQYENLMTSTCPKENEPSMSVPKEGDDLMKVLQSKEYSVWQSACDKYEHWLNKDDSATGMI